MGLSLDYSLIDPPVFDATGCLPWLYAWSLGRFCGIGVGAEYLADRLTT